MGRAGAVQRQVPAGFEVPSMGPGSRGGGEGLSQMAELPCCCVTEGALEALGGRVSAWTLSDCETCRGVW